MLAIEEVGVRRFGLLVGAMLALVPAVAQATFHLQTANEVMLASATGDTSVRFVELYDGGGAEESFPLTFGPYGLTIYDAGGHKLGSQGLSASGMANAALANRPYLISTPQADAAFPGHAGDEPLTVALPKTAGQACYTARNGIPYSCITWGCISHFVSTSGTGSFHGAVPGNGLSAQRQPDDSVQIGAPTPKTTNVPGAATKPCPTSGGSSYPGVTIHKQTVHVKSGKVPVSVKCPAKAKGSCVGNLVLKTVKPVKDQKGNRHVVTLGSASFTIAAGKAKTVKVKLSKAGKFVIAHHSSVSANATAKSHDGTGKSKTTSGHVTVKPPQKM